MNNNITLLYVEDDDGLRETYKHFFEKRVNKLLLAKNGEEGFKLFQENDPDIIVTDIRMPVMDGIEMIRNIREFNIDIPIVITTAFSERNYLLQAIELGVTRYILKPFEREKFREVIDDTIQYVVSNNNVGSYKDNMKGMDSYQKNIIIIANKKGIIWANKVFFDLTGFKTIVEIHDLPQHDSIIDSSIENDYLDMNHFLENLRFGNLLPLDGKKLNFYCDLIETSCTFLIKVEEFVYENEYVISLSDITDIMNTHKQLEVLNDQIKIKTNDIERANVILEDLEMINHTTRLPNEAMYNEISKNYHKKALSDNKSLGLLKISLQGLEAYKNNYGQVASDETVINIATQLKRALSNPYDFFAHLNDNEFVVIMLGCEESQILHTAHRLKDLIDRLHIPMSSKNTDEYITVSIGCAFANKVTENSTIELVHHADKMLEVSKNSVTKEVCY